MRLSFFYSLFACKITKKAYIDENLFRNIIMNQAVSKSKSVFGPIPSRRLGLSLGVDLLPFKTCPLDCIYCECGATTDHTFERKEYFPTASVIAEIDETLAKHPKMDYLTFSGVGEPTLHSGLGEIIRHVKTKWPNVKICLITNAVLLGDPGLQKELELLDLIMPSLDASSASEFETINKPVAGVTFESLMNALLSFRKNVKVTMWLEVFLVPDVNDSDESLARFAELLKQIGPDQVQLNSLDRPGVVDWIRVPTRERLEEIAGKLSALGVPDIEIISRVRPAPAEVKSAIDITTYNELILKTVRSRPCTAEDIATAISCDPDQVATHLRRMGKADLLTSEDGPRGTFYRPAAGK